MTKRNFIISFTVVFSVLFLCTNCMKELSYHAPDYIKTEFTSKFPGATAIEWSSNKGFIVADFRSKDSRHTRAWFDTSGSLVMIETIDPSLYEELPPGSQKTFREQFKFNTQDILNTYKLEFDRVETRYVVESRDKHTTTFLFFREKDGECFKTVEGKWENEPIIISDKIADEIKNEDKEIKIIDGWRQGEFLKLRAGIEKQHRMLCFDEDEEWVADYYEITKAVDLNRYEDYKNLVHRNFPELSKFKIYFVEYPSENRKNKVEKCLFIEADAPKSSLFINFKGEKTEVIPENVRTLLFEIKTDQ